MVRGMPAVSEAIDKAIRSEKSSSKEKSAVPIAAVSGKVKKKDGKAFCDRRNGNLNHQTCFFFTHPTMVIFRGIWPSEIWISAALMVSTWAATGLPSLCHCFKKKHLLQWPHNQDCLQSPSIQTKLKMIKQYLLVV